jgi:hypothetical protein
MLNPQGWAKEPPEVLLSLVGWAGFSAQHWLVPLGISFPKHSVTCAESRFKNVPERNVGAISAA